jgi:predicted O-methyltransferase YrrM
MDKNARLDTYLELLQPSLPQYLEEIEKYAHEEDVPIIRKPTQHFFRVFLSILNPKRILEIGTAIGFSALYMMENSSSDTTIDTIENYPPRIEVATKNISNSSYGDRINLIKGDAMEILPTLDSKYDLIFMDASKGQYINMLPMIKDLMHSGSVLISDNILQEGDIIESTFAIKRRNRTIHKRMREFLEVIHHDPDFVVDTMPIGDGITIAVRK